MKTHECNMEASFTVGVGRFEGYCCSICGKTWGERMNDRPYMPCVEDGSHSDDLAHEYEFTHRTGRHAPDWTPGELVEAFGK